MLGCAEVPAYSRQPHAKIRVARIEGVQVLDFTPEWDYTAGGTKLLLTGSVLPGARTEAHTRPLYIKFDQTEVPVPRFVLLVDSCYRAVHPHHVQVAAATAPTQQSVVGPTVMCVVLS